MRTRHVELGAFLILLMCFPGSSVAEPGEMEVGAFGGAHFFSKKTELGAFPGDSDGHTPKNSFAFGPRLSMALPLHTFVEAELAMMPTRTRNELSKLFIFGWRAQLGYELLLGSLRPFFVLGGGVMSLTSSNHDASAPDSDFHAHVGLGAKYLFSECLGLRADARLLMVPARTSNSAFTADSEFFLGAFYKFDLFRSAPKAEPVPAAALEPAQPVPPPPAPAREETPPPAESAPPPEEIAAFTGELPTLLFDFGSAELRPQSQRTLDAVAHTLSRSPHLRLEVAGHSDQVGPPELNETLSQRRAETVSDYLMKRGVAPSRLVSKGYGSGQLATPGLSKSANAQNRRVELRVLER